MAVRNILGEVDAALADTPVILLNGARQTGKSTLVKAIAAKVWSSRAKVSQQSSPGFIELWSLQSRMAYGIRNREQGDS